MVLSLGPTAVDTSAATKMIRSMDMALLSGQMVASTSVTGVKASSTAKVSTSKKERRDRVSGKWARELNGLRMQPRQPKEPNLDQLANFWTTISIQGLGSISLFKFKKVR